MTRQAPVSPLSIVAVTYNSASVLPGLLDSLSLGLEGIERFEVVIVDNDSRDNSADLAQAHPIGARVIRMGRNAGYAAGINAATATLDRESDVLILNPDVRLLAGSVRSLVDRLSDPRVGMAVPRIWNEDGTIAPSLRREPSLLTVWSDAVLGGRLAARLGLSETIDDEEFYKHGQLIQWATGAALLVSARARQRVGDWDETFFLYSEEVEYQRRMRDMGLSVAYVPEAQVVHIGGEYIKDPRLSALWTFNQIRYYARHHGAFSTAVFRWGLIVSGLLRATRGSGYRASLRAALAHPRPPVQWRTHHG